LNKIKQLIKMAEQFVYNNQAKNPLKKNKQLIKMAEQFVFNNQAMNQMF